MESVKLNELGSEDLKEMIATLQERLVIVETRKKTKKDDPAGNYCACDICGGKYTLKNKSTHCKTQKHVREVRYNDSIRRLARSKTIASRLNIPEDL